MNGQMRGQTSGGREGRWWHQTHSDLGIKLSGLLKFYFTGVDVHILRVNNYTGIMQRAYLRTRTHQSRALCHWVTRRNWGSCLYAALQTASNQTPNMPTATSTRVENAQRWQGDSKCVTYVYLLYRYGIWQYYEKNTGNFTLKYFKFMKRAFNN